MIIFGDILACRDLFLKIKDERYASDSMPVRSQPRLFNDEQEEHSEGS